MAPNTEAVTRGLKIFAVLILLYEVLACFMYGFFIRYRDLNSDLYAFDFLTATGLCMFVLIGFGLLQVYIRDVPLSGLGFTLLIMAISFQHYFLINAFWTKAEIQSSSDDNFSTSETKYFGLTIGEYVTNSLNINGKFYTVTYAFRCALTMVCAFSCIIGRAGPLEALLLVLIGTITYELNSQIITRYAIDFGGSIRIFTFAGFLGFFTSIVMNNAKNSTNSSNNRFISSRWNSMFALVGTIFIWALFPFVFANTAFYDALGGVYNAMRYATYFNIVMALTGSVIATFITTLMLRDRVGIRDVVHASIAGGVSIMTSANIITNPAAALTVGVVAGMLHTFWLNKIDRSLNRSSIKDSTGAFGLFGIAGFMGGVWSAIFTSFQQDYNDTRSAFTPNTGFNLYLSTGGYQFAATCMTAGIALVTGVIVGGILRVINRNDPDDQFTDATYWTVEDDGISSGQILPPVSGVIREGSQIKGKFAYM